MSYFLQCNSINTHDLAALGSALICLPYKLKCTREKKKGSKGGEKEDGEEEEEEAKVEKAGEEEDGTPFLKPYKRHI